MITSELREDCAVWLAMEVLSPKWSVHIILELMTAGEESLSYSDLQKLIPGINPRMLSIRLNSLIEQGLVKKILENPDTPKKVRYLLTETGKDLIPIVVQIRNWAKNNLKVNERCQSDFCRHAMEISSFLKLNPEKRHLVYLPTTSDSE